MKLLGVEKVDGKLPYLYSEWNLTYRVGWDSILKAVSLIYEYTDDPELQVGDADGDRDITVNDAEEVLSIEEYGRITITGTSQIIQVPVMITFYNQSDFVRVSVRCVTEEFEEADYKKFNLSMCQFLDSAEIAMFG
ncbi:MAG: hypothetical protein J5912_06165 [Clostridia bacterium]|jgi:hypothetical protein|nr:hypothetical protein [Clostridia bacterium]